MASGVVSLVDVELPTAADHLRYDEELLGAGRGVMRFWETTDECVVLGVSGLPERDVDLAACRGASVPVLRRCSGGGAVLLGLGCLNYSLVLPMEWNPAWRDVRYSLHWVMDRMCSSLGIERLRKEGDSDLALDGRKVSGNAQRRSHSAFLHHGTILYSFDAVRAEYFLRRPHREPAYRRGRSHRDFLGNIPLTADEIRQRVIRAWC